MTGAATHTLRLASILAMVGLLALAPGAFGQAAVDQYIPSADPSGKDSTGKGLDESQGSLGSEGGGIVVPDDGSAAQAKTDVAELPLTDYPATSFVTLVAAALAVALGLVLLIRFAPGLRRRLPGSS